MSDRIWLGTRKGLFKVDRATGKWRISDCKFVGDNVSMLHPERGGGRLFVAIDNGHFGSKLHRSEDGGASFKEIGVPEYPKQQEGIEEKDTWGKPLPWKLIRVWALESGQADQPGQLWCGTLPGGLFSSQDSGDSWQL